MKLTEKQKRTIEDRLETYKWEYSADSTLTTCLRVENTTLTLYLNTDGKVRVWYPGALIDEFVAHNGVAVYHQFCDGIKELLVKAFGE